MGRVLESTFSNVLGPLVDREVGNDCGILLVNPAERGVPGGVNDLISVFEPNECLLAFVGDSERETAVSDPLDDGCSARSEEDCVARVMSDCGLDTSMTTEGTPW